LGLVLSASGFKLYGYSNSFQSHMAGYRASGTIVLHQSVDGMSSSGYAMLKVLPGFQVAPKFTAHLSTATCDLSPELSLWNSGLDDGSNSSLSNEIFAFSFTELSENATIPLKQKFISETSSLLSLPLELKSIVILDELRSKFSAEIFRMLTRRIMMKLRILSDLIDCLMFIRMELKCLCCLRLMWLKIHFQ